MPFIVKAPAYLDALGQPVMHRKKAHRFADKDKSLAIAAAGLANGEVIHVIEIEPKLKPIVQKKKKHQSKHNQSWMKGLKK